MSNVKFREFKVVLREKGSCSLYMLYKQSLSSGRRYKHLIFETPVHGRRKIYSQRDLVFHWNASTTDKWMKIYENM